MHTASWNICSDKTQAFNEVASNKFTRAGLQRRMVHLCVKKSTERLFPINETVTGTR